MLNPKKPLRLKNNTKYFDPSVSKGHVRFSSPNSYQSRSIKIEGYETRLYWQYRYCDENDGQTFFYTLTYNDNALPHFYRYVCFDYEDLRDLLTGGFRKQLLRKYGTTFKYFVGAELGDGKGKRGMHNNPHYHVLFFLEDAHNPRFPYQKISPEDFRHLVRLYWQGFDEDEDKKKGIFHDYTEAKYGIAREGEDLGLVKDFRACCYCAKYVCKDVNLKMHEEKIENMARFLLKKSYLRSNRSYESFFRDVIYDLYNIPRNAKRTEWTFTDRELIDRLLPDAFDILRFIGVPDEDIDPSPFLAHYSSSIIDKYDLWEKYYNYCMDYVDEQVRREIVKYRNRYCNKCRISHGVGDYALKFIIDPMNPGIQVPKKKKGMKTRPLSMYYYRKLFTEVHIDAKGSPIRVLNALGQQYRLYHLDKQIDKLAEKTRSNLSVLFSSAELFEKMRESDVNTEVRYHYDSFLKRWNYLLNENNNDLDKILKCYAIYKLVYEDRFFTIKLDGSGCRYDFPQLDYRGDYKRFLVPTYFSVRRNDLRLEMFFDNPDENWLPYSEHPDFLRYIGVFNVFDLVADYLFIQEDNHRQKEAEERAATKRFHTQLEVKDFYKKFGL